MLALQMNWWINGQNSLTLESLRDWKLCQKCFMVGLLWRFKYFFQSMVGTNTQGEKLELKQGAKIKIKTSVTLVQF